MSDVNDNLQEVHRLLVEACKLELKWYIEQGLKTGERLSGSLVSSVSRLLSDNDVRATPADVEELKALQEQLSTARNSRRKRLDLTDLDTLDIH